MSDRPNGLDLDGFEVRDHVIANEVVARLTHELGEVIGDNNLRHGTRDLLRLFPKIEQLLASEKLNSTIQEYLSKDFFIARCLYFDKLPVANWKVAWHQDLSITVKSRVDLEGFGPWSRKNDDLHVHAPTAVLERMLAVRVHLDDCSTNNGPLKVIPGSQRLGRLGIDKIKDRAGRVKEIVCEVKKGGVLLMRPLLIHASSPAIEPSHRRVIHFELADFELPGGLEWRYRVI